MADFVKYNGYNVKDASALAHASISGKTLTTTDRKGRTVDTLTLPGGDFSSPIYKNHNEDPLDQALAIVAKETDLCNDVRGVNFWGHTYSEVLDWDPNAPAIQMYGTITADTINSWQNFAAKTKDYNDMAYQNAYRRQIRPKTYKAFASYTKTGGFTITAGSTYLIAYLPDGMTVQTPDGRTIGTAMPVSVRPIVGSTYAAPVILDITSSGVINAYNTSSTDSTILGFKVEFDIIIYDQFNTDFLENEDMYVPFIEGVYSHILTDSVLGTKTVETQVIVKNRGPDTIYDLDEYELQQVNGDWSWVKTSTQTIPTTSVTSYYNETFTFRHALGALNDSSEKLYTGALWYRVSLNDYSQSTSDVVILPRRAALT